MTTDKKPKSFYTLIFPKKPKLDHVSIQVKLKKNPKEFRVVLGVRSTDDRNNNDEPSMIALDFKTVFLGNDIKVTTNWKTDTGMQEEREVEDSDWIDVKKGIAFLTLSFENSTVFISEKGNNLITNFSLEFEPSRIHRLQLWGSIAEVQEIGLKYNPPPKRRQSPK